MEQDILKKLGEQDEKLEAIYRSVEKTRKYFFWVIVVSVVLFVLPLLGLLFAIPDFLSLYGEIGL